MKKFTTQAITGNKKVRIKFLVPIISGMLRQFPNNLPIWGNCEYTFDLDARDYDGLLSIMTFPAATRRKFFAVRSKDPAGYDGNRLPLNLMVVLHGAVWLCF